MLESTNVFQICIARMANVLHRFKHYLIPCIQEKKHVNTVKRRNKKKYKKFRIPKKKMTEEQKKKKKNIQKA